MISAPLAVFVLFSCHRKPNFTQLCLDVLWNARCDACDEALLQQTGPLRGQVTPALDQYSDSPPLITDDIFVVFYIYAMSELESFTLWGALPLELRYFIMLFVDFDTQETCILTNRETRLLTIAVRKSRKEIVVKRIINKQQTERQAASMVFRVPVHAINRSCSAVIRLEQVSY